MNFESANSEPKNELAGLDPVDDELLNRLYLADPIDPAELPDANEPKPQQILENIMSDKTTETEPIEQVLVSQHPAMAVTSRPPRRWGLMTAVAAAVMVLVGGALVLAPSNVEPALAEVYEAAASTADVETGRVTVELVFDGTDGSETEQMTGELSATFVGDDFAVSANLADSSDGENVEVAEQRLVDGLVYLNNDSQWYQMEAPEFVASTLTELVDPRSVLTAVQELAEATEVGPATVDGVETTHYESMLDLADETLSESGWLSSLVGEIEADGEVEIDLYVDNDGLLRQLDLSGDLQEEDGGDGQATFEMSTTFSDLGADLTIEAPTDAIEMDPLADLDRELGPSDEDE